MSLVDKIPTLSDAQVINLLDNARRLQADGDDRQRAAAAELLPVLEAAAAERRADRLARAQDKRAAARAVKSAAACSGPEIWRPGAAMGGCLRSPERAASGSRNSAGLERPPWPSRPPRRTCPT